MRMLPLISLLATPCVLVAQEDPNDCLSLLVTDYQEGDYTLS